MNRAYSVLTVKAVDDEQRVITGMATTPTPDRMGDIVEPLGVEFKNPLPLLWQHQADKPVGTVKFGKPTKTGIPFEAKILDIPEVGALKDRLDEAWQSVKYKLVAAVSIGFRALEYAFIEGTGGIRFEKSEVMELSLVTIPANAEAVITTIKSIDTKVRAATGIKDGEDRPVPPGVTGKSPRNSIKLTPEEGKEMKTIQEQIAALEAKRAATAARMSEIMQKGADDGRTTDAAEQEEFDNLEAELEPIDKDLGRFRALEKAQIASAKPVVSQTKVGDGTIRTVEDGSAVRGGSISVRNKELPKGTAFTRYVIALARAKGNLMQAAEIAKNNEQWMAESPEVETVLKSAVAAGTTTDTAWALPLVNYTQMTSEFIELLRPATIIGRIPGLRRVPFNISMPKQTSSSTVGWVGEGSPKPVSALGFETVNLRWAKIAGIVVISEELARLSNPAAEGVVRQDLIDTIVQFMDRQFVDPTVSAVAGVNPASITNGVTPITATGTTAAAFRADVKSLFAAYHTAGLSRAGAAWIMTETMLQSLAMMPNALGQPEFKGLDDANPTLWGLPVIASENIPATGGSPADGSLIILFKPSEIYLADDGGVTVDASREASVQMDNAPDSPQTASTTLVSLWQTNRIGIRAERWINWDRRRDEAVQFIQNAKYSE